MKNSITTFVCALAMSISIVIGNYSEDKSKSAGKNLLPPTGPVPETPAPQRTRTNNDYVKYTPAQKASIVALKVAK